MVIVARASEGVDPRQDDFNASLKLSPVVMTNKLQTDPGQKRVPTGVVGNQTRRSGLQERRSAHLLSASWRPASILAGNPEYVVHQRRCGVEL